MLSDRRRFIVLYLVDRDDWGFDEATLRTAIGLMDAAVPDQRQFWHTGVAGYFLTSAEALGRVQVAVEEAEKLRGMDGGCPNLGIGIAEGPLIAEFAADGQLTNFVPVGEAANEAARCARSGGACHPVLQRLEWEFCPGA